MELALSFDLLQGTAAVLGMAGRGSGTRAAGFGCWIVGNVLWVVFGLAQDNPYLASMFGFYLLTAVMGYIKVMNY